MSERVAPGFQRAVIAVMSVSAALLAALLLFVIGDGIVRFAIAVAGYFLLRRIWGATRRKRDLSTRGFHVGRRVGTHWVYEEVHGGEAVAIELELAYLGRAEYEIHIPGEREWLRSMPAWARERRGEIVERLGTVFKRSEMRMHDA
jgi:hypothetical protein